MDHFDAFIRFQQAVPHSDEYAIVGRGIDSRVWMSKDGSFVIKEYNRCHSRIGVETLVRYHEIQSGYAERLTEAGTETPELGRASRLTVEILALPTKDIYHEKPTGSHRWRLYSKVPFIPGSTLQELLSRHWVEDPVCLDIELRIRMRLLEIGIPIAGDASGDGYPLTRENVRIQQSKDGIRAIVTDLWADIARTVKFENGRRT